MFKFIATIREPQKSCTRGGTAQCIHFISHCMEYERLYTASDNLCNNKSRQSALAACTQEGVAAYTLLLTCMQISIHVDISLRIYSCKKIKRRGGRKN